MENQCQLVENKQLVIAIPANHTIQATHHHEDHENTGAAAPLTPGTAAAAAAAKKKRGGNQILQAAMFLLRRRPSKKSLLKDKEPSVERVASKNAWKRLVGSMRPLHLQDNPSSPKSSPIFEIAAAPSTPTGSEAGYQDVLPSPMSPAHATDFMSRSSSEDSMQSRYASAVNLQELDRSEQDDDDDDDKIKGKGVNIHDGDEDEHIDAKAEEFIAQFYHQMKLQPLD